MGATPTATNQVATIIDSIVSAGISGGETGIQTFIAATPTISWLEWPGINVITNLLVQALGNSLYNQAKDLVANVVIDIQTKAEESAILQAQQNIVKAQSSGDSNALKIANTAFDTAMASLMHSDGST